MPWTDEMVESLKKMWDEGLSTGEIGRRLGVSKNSIVGKVHRLQLVARPSPIKKKSPDGTSASTPKTPTQPKTKPTKEKKADTKAKTKTEAEVPSPKKVETPNTASTASKPTTAKTPIKEKEADAFLNMNISIPVHTTPRKPGDKVTVTDLDNHTCRWPIGDPKDENFHFCGAKVKIGQTYCEEHAAIAYVKTLKK